MVKTLLAGQRPDGGFGVHPYVPKWTGTRWRLVSLVELGIPPGYRPAIKAADQVLKWLTVRYQVAIEALDCFLVLFRNIGRADSG